MSRPSATQILAYLVPTAAVATVVAVAGTFSPWARLALATVGVLWSIKVGATLLLRARGDPIALSPVQRLLFWLGWPDVRPDAMSTSADDGGSRDAGGVDGSNGDVDAPESDALESDAAEPGASLDEDDERRFLEGYVTGLLGIAAIVGAVLAVPHVGLDAATWLLLAGLLCVAHLGVAVAVPVLFRWLGVAVPTLFDRPHAATGVGDFWARRWNLPFVRMNRLFVTKPLAPRVGIGVAAALGFLVSAVLHEVAISVTAGGGWGLPIVYFVIQGGAYAAEARWFPPGEDGAAGPAIPTWIRRVWTWLVVLAPLPLLFHAPFRHTFLAPILTLGRELLLARPPSWYLGVALWLGAAGHVLVLGASFQVPDRLNWREELPRLGSFNRKLVWTYGGFIVLTIVAFAALTAAFHGQFVRGTPVALGLATFVAVFWAARIGVDALYFTHEDWPEGFEFVVGHALLTTLFGFLVAVYGGTVVWHVLA